MKYLRGNHTKLQDKILKLHDKVAHFLVHYQVLVFHTTACQSIFYLIHVAHQLSSRETASLCQMQPTHLLLHLTSTFQSSFFHRGHSSLQSLHSSNIWLRIPLMTFSGNILASFLNNIVLRYISLLHTII